MKTCTACKQPKPTTTQYFHPNGQGALRSACKDCEKERFRARRQAYVKRAVFTEEPEEDEEPKSVDTMLAEHRRDIELRKLRHSQNQLLASLTEAQERQKVLDELSNFDAFKVRPRELTSGVREATAVVLCSDWHVEEPVEPEKVNGMNEYNLSIAEHRIDKLIEGILWRLGLYEGQVEVRDLVLFLGGDHYSGYIHEELMESAQLSPIECILWLQPQIVRMIDTILSSTNLEKIYIPCTYGNHGRTTAKPRIATGAENSYEWLLFNWLIAHYRNESRVEIVAPKSQLVYMDIYDYTLRFTHGDAVKYYGGVGGLSIPINKAIASWDIGRRAHYTCMGHWHQLQFGPHFVVNGSLIGYNAYSVRIKSAYEPPQQAFFLIDSKRGRTDCAPLWVDEVPAFLARA